MPDSSLPHDHPVCRMLVQAVQQGPVERVRALATEHDLASIRVVDEHGTHKTLLHVVADWPGHRPGAAEMVACLVEIGVPVDAPSSNPKPGSHRETALHWAASSDDVVLIEALIRAGADLEAPGAVFTDGTPLSDAVIFQQWRAAECLLGHGARATPWQAAALGLVDVLAEALPTLTDAERNAALWHAARSGRQELVELLVQAGADPHFVGPMGWTPIRAAEDSGDAALVAWLRAL